MNPFKTYRKNNFLLFPRQELAAFPEENKLLAFCSMATCPPYEQYGGVDRQQLNEMNQTHRRRQLGAGREAREARDAGRGRAAGEGGQEGQARHRRHTGAAGRTGERGTGTTKGT